MGTYSTDGAPDGDNCMDVCSQRLNCQGYYVVKAYCYLCSEYFLTNNTRINNGSTIYEKQRELLEAQVLSKFKTWQSSFFQNEEIFVKLDELDELDIITHALIGSNKSLTKAQSTFYALGSIPGQVTIILENIFGWIHLIRRKL